MKDKLHTFSPRTRSLIGDTWAHIAAIATDVDDLRFEATVTDIEDALIAENIEAVKAITARENLRLKGLQERVVHTAIRRRNDDGEPIDVYMIGNTYYPFP